MKLKVLYEDNHLLAVNKPAGAPTMGAKPGVRSVLDEAKAYLATKYHKPGAVYLGVVSRLDAPVTGVLLLARTSKAAGRLTAAFRERTVDKQYLAIVQGAADPPSQRLVHFLKKDERRRRMFATTPNASGAQRAELAFETLERLPHGGEPARSLLAIRLLTGRKHQIRVQLAKAGLPILGDERYGGPAGFADGIALHAWRLSLEHPVRREPLTIVAPPPASWGKLVDRSRFGG